MSWQIILYFLTIASGILSGAIRFSKLNRSSKYFFILLVTTLLTEGLAWYAAEYYNNNLWVYRPFIFVQFGLIIGALYQELSKCRRWLLISFFVVLIAGIVDLFINSKQLLDHYPTAVKSLISVLICLWTLICLKRLLNTDMKYSFTNYPLFWLSIGWLLFSVITLVSFSAHNYIGISSPRFIAFFYHLRMASNLMLYSLFIIAFMSPQKEIK